MRSNGERGGDFGGFTQYQDLFEMFDHNRNRYSKVAVVVMDFFGGLKYTELVTY